MMRTWRSALRQEGLGALADAQSICDFAGDLLRRAADIDDNRIFVWRGFLEDRERAVQQDGWHEVAAARRHALVDEIERSLEVHQPNVRPIADDDIPVRPFQRRTGDHARLA